MHSNVTVTTDLAIILPRPAAHRAAEVAAVPAGHAAAGAVVEEQPVPLVGGEPERQRPRLPHLPRVQFLKGEGERGIRNKLTAAPS